MKYTPSVLPIDPREAVTVLQVELERISQSFNSTPILPKLTIEPPDKEDGMLAYADGSTWNPGGGAGIYWYNGTTWTKL
jgi:hypothetical protein